VITIGPASPALVLSLAPAGVLSLCALEPDFSQEVKSPTTTASARKRMLVIVLLNTEC
jgi:hypothetical protein